MFSARRLGLALVAVILIPSAPALAQTPLVDGYAPPGGPEQSQIAPQGDVKGEATKPTKQASGATPALTTGTPTAPTAATAARDTSTGGSSLPFTGLDARLIALAGALLVLVGLGTRRLAARTD